MRPFPCLFRTRRRLPKRLFLDPFCSPSPDLQRIDLPSYVVCTTILRQKNQPGSENLFDRIAETALVRLANAGSPNNSVAAFCACRHAGVARASNFLPEAVIRSKLARLSSSVRLPSQPFACIRRTSRLRVDLSKERA